MYAVKIEILKPTEVMVRASVTQIEEMEKYFSSRNIGAGNTIVSGFLMHREEEYTWLKGWVEKWNEDQSYDSYFDMNSNESEGEDEIEGEPRSGPSKKVGQTLVLIQLIIL